MGGLLDYLDVSGKLSPAKRCTTHGEHTRHPPSLPSIVIARSPEHRPITAIGNPLTVFFPRPADAVGMTARRARRA
jgi:hypothetical protein